MRGEGGGGRGEEWWWGMRRWRLLKSGEPSGRNEQLRAMNQLVGASFARCLKTINKPERFQTQFTRSSSSLPLSLFSLVFSRHSLSLSVRPSPPRASSSLTSLSIPPLSFLEWDSFSGPVLYSFISNCSPTKAELPTSRHVKDLCQLHLFRGFVSCVVYCVFS